MLCNPSCPILTKKLLVKQSLSSTLFSHVLNLMILHPKSLPYPLPAVGIVLPFCIGIQLNSAGVVINLLDLLLQISLDDG